MSLQGRRPAKRKSGKKRGLAHVRGGKTAATRAVGLLGGIFAYAVRHRMRLDNPVHGVMRFADGKRERRLSDDEYKSLGDALAKAKMEKHLAGGSSGGALPGAHWLAPRRGVGAPLGRGRPSTAYRDSRRYQDWTLNAAVVPRRMRCTERDATIRPTSVSSHARRRPIERLPKTLE